MATNKSKVNHKGNKAAVPFAHRTLGRKARLLLISRENPRNEQTQAENPRHGGARTSLAHQTSQMHEMGLPCKSPAVEHSSTTLLSPLPPHLLQSPSSTPFSPFLAHATQPFHWHLIMPSFWVISGICANFFPPAHAPAPHEPAAGRAGGAALAAPAAPAAPVAPAASPFSAPASWMSSEMDFSRSSMRAPMSSMPRSFSSQPGCRRDGSRGMLWTTTKWIN